MCPASSGTVLTMRNPTGNMSLKTSGRYTRSRGTKGCVSALRSALMAHPVSRRLQKTSRCLVNSALSAEYTTCMELRRLISALGYLRRRRKSRKRSTMHLLTTSIRIGITYPHLSVTNTLNWFVICCSFCPEDSLKLYRLKTRIVKYVLER